jgi:hypothetical protein
MSKPGPSGFNVECNVLQLLRPPVEKYAFAMALWTAAELKLDVPNEVVRHIDAFLSKKKNWRYFRTQDLRMMLTGTRD